MPDKEGKPTRSRPSATPEDFPTTPSPQTGYPSGDYSYVLEIVMRMQESVGRLTEAVTSLKDQSKSHGEKLDSIGKDVHAAKVVIGVVGGLIVLVGGICAWLINTYISVQHSHK
jgi:hypothetical protein